MLPSRSRGSDPAPAAIERTAGCCFGGSLSIPAAPPPHGGDPRPALVVGAVRDAPAGVDIQDGGRRLHKHVIPVEVSQPTAADGFEEASVARDGYRPLPPLRRHPSLIRDQMRSGQSAEVNSLVTSAPAGGRAGGGGSPQEGEQAYDHGKEPSLLLLLAATRELPAQASVARSQLPPSIVRAYFFTLVLFLLCAGGSCTPVLKNEFTMEFCAINTSETCAIPLSHPFKRPIPIHRTWLTEQIPETRSVRLMLEDQKHKCNNSQSLDFRIVSMAAPTISFFANFAPLINVYGIGQVEERGKLLFATSSTIISASNFFWGWYQYKQQCPNVFKITILILAGVVHLDYALFFCISSDVNRGWSLFIIFLGLSASATCIWNELTSSILGLICMAIGHIIRVGAIRRYRTANVILACFGLVGGIPVFYRENWKSHQILFTISTLISSGSRIIDLGLQVYYYRTAPEGVVHIPPLGQVVPEDIVQASNKLPVQQGVHDAPIRAPNVAGEVGGDEAPHDGIIAEEGEDGAHVPPLGQVVTEDIVQGSNLLPVPQGDHDAGEVGDHEAPRDVAIAEGGDQEDGNGGAPEVAIVAPVAVIQNAPAPVGAPDVEVAAAADAE